MAENSVQVFAHRGGRNWAPENTMAAFKKSLDLGVDGIELDVQRCASGELVVFHDADLSRTTNGAGLLKDCQWDELQRLSAGAWFDEEFKEEKVPLLSEVLQLVDGSCVINVEVKSLPHRYEGIEEALVEVIEQYKYPERIIFSSFDNEVISSLAKLKPDWNYAILLVGVPVNLPEYAKSIRAQFWNPQYKSIHKDAVQTALDNGLKVYPWTANDARSWSQLIEMGVTGLITDKPDELTVFLQEVDFLVSQ